MSKRVYTFLLVAILAPCVIFGQAKLKKPVKLVEQTNQVVQVATQNNGSPNAVTAANYVAVDTMANVYGPAISVLNPLVYDPYSNVLTVVYRGNARTYAAGSGELWYSYSLDNGGTWNRSVTSVQDGAIGNWARYPSMAISNATQSTLTDDILLAFSWPDLQQSGAGFGYVGYAADLGLQGSAIAGFDPGTAAEYSSQVPTFANDMEPFVFWASDNGVDARIDLWRTSDYTDIVKTTPWRSSDFGDGGNITMGGVGYDGVLYYAVSGTFDAGFVGPGGWGIGYSKSTDNGDTWSAWNVVDWSAIPATSQYTELWDYIKVDGFVSYCGDINVDKDGYVHIVAGLTKIDTAVSADYGENALVEFYETATGWDAMIIFDDQDYLADSTFTQNDGPGLGQMGPSVYLGFDPMREYLVSQWVTSGTPGDSLCDVYMSFRKLDGGTWSAPMNLTETPAMNENSSHLSPLMSRVDNANDVTVTAYSFYCYEAGNTGSFITGVSDLNATVVYIAPVEYVFPTVGVEETGLDYSYNLEQNYPNPFNPATTIKFSIPTQNYVTLKVYDILGNEVATLVNEVRNEGSYNVNFDASGLASGAYLYKLTAGEFTSTHKMLLLK